MMITHTSNDSNYLGVTYVHIYVYIYTYVLTYTRYDSGSEILFQWENDSVGSQA